MNGDVMKGVIVVVMEGDELGLELNEIEGGIMRG